MKTLYISSTVEDELFDEIVLKSKKVKPSNAAQRFEKMIAKGLGNLGEIELLSYLPLTSYPNHKMFMKIKRKTKLHNMNLSYIPLINISFIKQIIIFIHTFLFLIAWSMKNLNVEKKVLLSVVYPPTALPAIFLAKFLKFKVIVVVPDVSRHRFNYNVALPYFKKLTLKCFEWISIKTDNKFDGYIFLTEQMNVLINNKNKPYIVMEGMIEKEGNQVSQKEYSIETNEPFIMYAGGLKEKFGIAKLINAFKKIERKDITLVIFGSGDYETEVLKSSRENNRVKFMGLKSQSEVFEYERKATLLINPRPSNEEFTKYSFPSKTLEYMSSGTPLLSTDLPGIPEEYRKYLFYFDDESLEGFVKTMDFVLDKNEKYLTDFGYRAKVFVLSNKNYEIQTNKIYEFLKKVNL